MDAVKRKSNSGWFMKGHDPRRRRGFPRWACRKGFRTTVNKYPHLLDWLMGRFLSQRHAARKRRKELPW